MQWKLFIHFPAICAAVNCKTRKLSYRKDDRVMRPVYGCPENFWESLSTPMTTLPKFLMGFCSDVPAIFQVCSFICSWDNRGYSKNFGNPWICPHSLFCKIFHGLLFGWTLRMYRPDLTSVALPIPEIIAIAVLGWGCKTTILGRGGRKVSGMVPFERALVSSYRPSIVTFHLSLYVSEILPLLCSSMPLFPTLPLVSPQNFPMIPCD